MSPIVIADKHARTKLIDNIIGQAEGLPSVGGVLHTPLYLEGPRSWTSEEIVRRVGGGEVIVEYIVGADEPLETELTEIEEFEFDIGFRIWFPRPERLEDPADKLRPYQIASLLHTEFLAMYQGGPDGTPGDPMWQGMAQWTDCMGGGDASYDEEFGLLYTTHVMRLHYRYKRLNPTEVG